MKKRILVTGAAGFIGSNLVRYLLYSKNNYSVIGVDSIKDSKNIHNLYSNKSSEFYIADITDESIMQKIFEVSRPDIIINLVNSFEALSPLLRSVYWYQNVSSSKVKFIQRSSITIYKDEDCIEGCEIKASNEEDLNYICSESILKNFCDVYSLQNNIIRTDPLFGPRQPKFRNMITCIQQHLNGGGKEISLSSKGEIKRNLMHIEDFNNSVICVIERGSDGEVYNVSSGSDFTDLEIAFFIKEKMKSDANIVFGIDSSLEDSPKRYYNVNTDKIRKLGWKPRLPFKERVCHTVEWASTNQWFYK